MTTQQLQYKMATAKVNNSKQKVEKLCFLSKFKRVYDADFLLIFQVVYTQDGVFVHTSVPTHIANIIPGRVSLIERVGRSCNSINLCFNDFFLYKYLMNL